MPSEAARCEVGIRVALGANPANVIRLLSRQTLLLIAAGAVVGIYCYFLAAHWIQKVLYDVTPLEPWAMTAALFFVLIVAVIAIAAPVRKAVRIDPASALRHE